MKPKIKQLEEKYDLDLDHELVRRREDGHTYRDLRDYINERVVAAALQDESISISTSDVLDVLRYDSNELTDYQADVLFSLEQHGVDIEALEADLISHVTVRKYLQDELGVTDKSDPMTKEKAFRTIDWALSRDQDILKKVLQQLADKGELNVGSGVSVSISATVRCDDSGQRWAIERFIEQGGCNNTE